MAGGRWSDLRVEANYRRGFFSGTGVGGEACTATDDDLTVSAGYRVPVTTSKWAPSVGLGAGWSRVRTSFHCADPLVNTEYRGFDLQLQARQPLWPRRLNLDLAVGPRFLVVGPGDQAGLSIAGEAWLTAQPVSVVFVRAGARLVHAQLSSPSLSLSVTDLRVFAALEAGVFL